MDLKTDISNSDFLFFSEEEINGSSDVYEILNIIKKYNILKDDNELVGPKDKNHLYLVKYILNLEKNEENIPLDIQNIFLNNNTLKQDINSYLEKKLSILLEDNNSHIVKDINILSSISSLGFKYKILNQSNDINLENLSKIFRAYENRLQDLFKNNAKLFDNTFNTYMILLKTLFKISTLKSIDILKNSEIHNIMELIVESVNIVKYNILLNNLQLSRINNLLGRYLYVFTHLEKIEVYPDDVFTTSMEFLSYFNRQEDGFELAKNNNFGFESEFDAQTEFLLYKSYSAIFILKLLKKLERASNLDFMKNPIFKKIIKSFYKRFIFEKDGLISKDINVVKTDLLNSLVFNYSSDLSFDKRQNYKYVLEDFILNDTKLNNKNLETIYRLLYFVDNIKEYNYFHIANILVNSELIKNGYQEFFKLAIFDLYISKINSKNSLEDDDIILLDNIASYSMQNNSNIYLQAILTKIYLNIARIFAKNGIKKDRVEELYFLVLIINKLEVIEDNYSNQNLVIIKYLHILPDEVETKFIDTFIHNIVNSFDLAIDSYFAKNLTKDKNINFFKEYVNKDLFFYFVDIEFNDEIISYLEKHELESFVYDINSKNKVAFLYIKNCEEIFNKIYKLSRHILKDKFDKLFAETNKSSANYYLADDDLIF